MANGAAKSAAARLLLTVAIALLLSRTNASAAEVCIFTGTTDYAGRITATTETAATGGIKRVDVAVTFETTTMFWLRIRYLIEEISTYRSGELESLAVNSRYLIGGHIVRQQWDEFRRGTDGLQAHRVQAKTLGDFRRRHPGFVQHWDPSAFGHPWLHDYQFASPERRADLDLRGSPFPSGLRPPLAMAFYWIRWLPRGGQDVPVFLPGFKAKRLVHLPITAVPSTGDTLWRAPLHYPALSEKPASSTTAWTSPDGRLLRLAFELHQSRGSASGTINLDRCDGSPVDPGHKPR